MSTLSSPQIIAYTCNTLKACKTVQNIKHASKVLLSLFGILLFLFFVSGSVLANNKITHSENNNAVIFNANNNTQLPENTYSEGVCCDQLQIFRVDDRRCCVNFISEDCKVDSIFIHVDNGVISSANWNCSTPIQTGYVQQSTFAFYAGGCAVNMMNCFEQTLPGLMVVHYTVLFSDGEICTRTIELECEPQPMECCDMLELYQDPDLKCCVQLISNNCKVDSIFVHVDNGIIASANWNCSTPIQTGYVQQSTFAFNAAGCAVSMLNCFEQTLPGIMLVHYTVLFSNGEICSREIEIECEPTQPPVICCDELELFRVSDQRCCVQLISEDCEVDSIVASVDNGTFASANWNCNTPIQQGFAQQSNFTFYPGACNVSMMNCFDQTTQGSMIATYTVYFTNGEVCTKEIEITCEPITPVICCDELELFRVSDQRCCVQLISEDCEVDSIVASVDNGTFASANWNCNTPIQQGYAQQSNFTFYPGACNVSMMNCFDQTSQGSMIATYTVYFSNGEECIKEIEIKCEPVIIDSCCNMLELYEIPGKCCVQLISEDCGVDSIIANIDNGIFNAANWNCNTPIQQGFAQQSNFTFYPGACNVSMMNCFDQTTQGSMIASYTVYFENGEICTKEIELECETIVKPDTCCQQLEIYEIEGECCVRVISERCLIDSIFVDIDNGTFTSASWNCNTQIQQGFAQQSSFTFYPGVCNMSMTNCFDQTDPGSMIISYTAYFENGETCTKEIELQCDSTDCCPNIGLKLRSLYPPFHSFTTRIGTFTITNCDPLRPICSVEIYPQSAGNFIPQTLKVDGVSSTQTWNSSNIPATGNFTTPAINTVEFSLRANYNGYIDICINRCDGSQCWHTVRWRAFWIIDDLEIGIKEIVLQPRLYPISISPYVPTQIDNNVKSVIIGYYNQDETNNNSYIFAASIDDKLCSDNQNGLYPAEILVGQHNAIFELNCPYNPSDSNNLPMFNMVFAGNFPELACTLIDEEGGIIFSDRIEVTEPDTINTSVSTNKSATYQVLELINVYPNPSDGNFTITYVTTSTNNVNMRLVNSAGQVLHTRTVNPAHAGLNKETFNKNILSEGVYHIVIESGGYTDSKPFVKK